MACPTGRQRSFCSFDGKTINTQDAISRRASSSSNVVAWLEGSDPDLKHEYVVLGSHLDHLGIRGGQVYPGADDNGSGSTAVLNIAKAFSENDVPSETQCAVHLVCSGRDRPGWIKTLLRQPNQTARRHDLHVQHRYGGTQTKKLPTRLRKKTKAASTLSEVKKAKRTFTQSYCRPTSTLDSVLSWMKKTFGTAAIKSTSSKKVSPFRFFLGAFIPTIINHQTELEKSISRRLSPPPSFITWRFIWRPITVDSK